MTVVQTESYPVSNIFNQGEAQVYIAPDPDSDACTDRSSQTVKVTWKATDVNAREKLSLIPIEPIEESQYVSH